MKSAINERIGVHQSIYIHMYVCGQQRTLFRYISNKGERDGGARAMLTSRSDYHECCNVRAANRKLLGRGSTPRGSESLSLTYAADVLSTSSTIPTLPSSSPPWKLFVSSEKKHTNYLY
ncbi:hypothetical protein MUK42_36990 [Musa troglodytarum]|uniref:Uncharacterized protein n=1 Tax=Musa troglodytarum TaxID=320322 RepID=A0A9E7FS54_9LILI|nr:hypothetical protein MUK42_36990 [Musa troglodytarum]